MGNQKPKEENMWQQRKITLLYLIILVLIITFMVMAVRSIVSYVESDRVSSSEEGSERYEKKYNASRFFFRLYFPDRWDVNSETNGFWLDRESNLVLELYPSVHVVHTDAPAASPDGAPEGTVRDESLTAGFYYYEYSDVQKQWMQEHPSEVPPVTEQLTEVINKTDLNLLGKIADDVYARMTGSFDPNVYTWDESLKTLETTDITFRYFTYQYTKDGVAHTADAYIAVRTGNYYVIIYDGVSTGEENAYQQNKTEFLSILEEFRFSVFED